MGLAHSPLLVTNGLTFCLDAANIKSYAGSGTSWLDISGLGISASLQNSGSGTVTGTGGATGYLDFAAPDATSTVGYYLINSSTLSSLTNELTIETCVYVNNFYTSSGNTHARPVSPRATETYSPIGFGIFNGGITVEVNASGNWFTGSYANAAVTSGVWLYISQTTSNDAQAMKTYYNGALVNTLSFTGTPSAGNGYLLGRGYYGGTLNYSGRIALFRVYNRALTANEIYQNFVAIRGRYGI